MTGIFLTNQDLPEDYFPPTTLWRLVMNSGVVTDWKSLPNLNSNLLSDLRNYLVNLYGEAPLLKYKTFSPRILEDKFGYQYWGSWFNPELNIKETEPTPTAAITIVVDSLL